MRSANLTPKNINPTRKWDEGMNRNFTENEVQRANKPMKK